MLPTQPIFQMPSASQVFRAVRSFSMPFLQQALPRDAFMMCVSQSGGAAGVPPSSAGGGSTPPGSGEGGGGGKPRRLSLWSHIGDYLESGRWQNPRIELALPSGMSLDYAAAVSPERGNVLGFSLVPLDSSGRGVRKYGPSEAVLPPATYISGRRQILPKVSGEEVRQWKRRTVNSLRSAQKAQQEGKFAHPPSGFHERERILTEAHGAPVRIITSLEDITALHRATSAFLLCFFLAQLPDGSGRLYATTSNTLHAFDGERIIYSGRIFLNPDMRHISLTEAYGPDRTQLKDEYKTKVADFIHLLLGEPFER